MKRLARILFLARVCLPSLLVLMAGRVRADGGPGYAASFNGSNSFVSIPAFEPPSNNYTLSAWVFLNDGGSETGTRLAVLSTTTCGDSIEFLIHSSTSSATAPQYLELGRCGAFNGILSTNQVPIGQWTHVAVTVTSNNQVSYYIYGEAAGTWNAGTSDLSLGSALNLGDNSGSRRFNGLLDEVQIWEVALGQSQIQSNMNRSLTGNESGLIGYFKFDEGSGIIAFNSAAKRS
jgi:hypothetical protein